MVNYDWKKTKTYGCPRLLVISIRTSLSRSRACDTRSERHLWLNHADKYAKRLLELEPWRMGP